MSVTSISRDSSTNVSIVRMTVTDSLATVANTNYILGQQHTINILNSGPWQWYITDTVLVSANNGNEFFEFTDATFTTLKAQTQGGTGTVSSGLINQLAWYAANGTTVSGLPTANNGVLTTTSGGVPGIRTTLPSGLTIPGYATQLGVQDQSYTHGVDTGITNAYVFSCSPVISSYTDGMILTFTPANANSGASTVNAGAGVVPILNFQGNALIGTEIEPPVPCIIQYSSGLSSFLLQNLVDNNPGNVSPQQIQKQSFTYAVDTGIADAYVVSYTPAITSLTDGLTIWFQASNNNATTSPTIAVNGLSPVPIQRIVSFSVPVNSIVAGNDYLLIYNLTNNIFELVNPDINSFKFATASSIQNQQATYATDFGTANAYAINLSPAIGSYNDGQLFSFIAGNSNTGNSTLNVNSLGAISIKAFNYAQFGNNIGLVGGEIVAGRQYFVIYNATQTFFYLLNSSINSSFLDVQNQNFTYATDSGVANAYVLTLSVALAQHDGFALGYDRAQLITFIAGNSNTGSSTVAINGLSADNIVVDSNGAYTNLIGGEIVSGNIYRIIFIGGKFLLLNPSAKYPVAAKTILTPLSGDIVTLTTGILISILNPAGTLATLTVNMPASPKNNQLQTVSTTQTITSLTVGSAGSDTIVAAPTTLTSGQTFTMIYDLGTTSWYPA